MSRPEGHDSNITKDPAQTWNDGSKVITMWQSVHVPDSVRMMLHDGGPSAREVLAARKRDWIIKSAIPLFLQNGYRGTSVDEIAAVASVSKQTVYKYFRNKEGLFTEIIFSTIEAAYRGFQPPLAALHEADDVEQGLRVFARILLTTLMQPRVVQTRRLVIAEANRFPGLGSAYYEQTYLRAVSMVAESINGLAGRGLLQIDDPMAAAHHFTWLIIGVPRNKVMLCGDHISFTQEELEQHADDAVRVFLAAYG